MTKLILAIDDAATVRLYHRKLLTGAGWQVEEASNGVQALEAVAERGNARPFDLFVVDVNMPKMDGYSFVRELRRLAVQHSAPVLMVSTEAQAGDAAAAFNAGANAYLVKPVKPAELVLTAALMLGEAGAAQRAAAARALEEAGERA